MRISSYLVVELPMWDKPLEDKCKQVWFQYNYVHIYIYIIVLYVLSWIGLTTSQWFPCCMRRSETQIHKCSLLAIFAKVVEKSHWTSLLNGRMASALPSTRWYKDVSVDVCLAKLKKYSQASKTMIWFHLFLVYNGIPILSDSGTPKKTLHQPPQPLLECSVLPTYASLPFPAPPALYSVDAKRGILPYPLKDRQYHICSSW